MSCITKGDHVGTNRCPRSRLIDGLKIRYIDGAIKARRARHGDRVVGFKDGIGTAHQAYGTGDQQGKEKSCESLHDDGEVRRLRKPNVCAMKEKVT